MTNKRNASGVPDPTTYEAIKNADFARELKARHLLQVFARGFGFDIVKLKLTPIGGGEF